MIHVLRETHEAPEEVSRVLLVAGGRNRFGEPNYRAVWGWSRLDWIGGRFEDRDEHGILIREVVCHRREPKYTPLNRWHIERWLPPEMYGLPQLWWGGELEKELGPYPSRGDWEHCFTLEGPRLEFVQLTPSAARYIAQAIETSRQSRRVSLAEKKSRHIASEDREYDSYADSLFNTGSTITGPQVSVL